MNKRPITEAVALAICNAERSGRGLEPVKHLDEVKDPGHYRNLANAALNAYLDVTTK